VNVKEVSGIKIVPIRPKTQQTEVIESGQLATPEGLPEGKQNGLDAGSLFCGGRFRVGKFLRLPHAQQLE
jgi:hypothetical protein